MSAESVEHYEPVPLPIPRGGGSFDRVGGYQYTVVDGALVVTPKPGTPPLTADDVPPLPPGYRDEIIEGQMIVTPGPADVHQTIVGELLHVLRPLRVDGWQARADRNVKVDLDADDFCRPDVCVFRPGEKIKRRPGEGVWHTFDQFGLLVEIASRSTRWIDDDKKITLYASNGVPMYWRIQPSPDGGAPTVFVHTEPDGDSYRTVRRVGPGEKLDIETPFRFALEPDLLID